MHFNEKRIETRVIRFPGRAQVFYPGFGFPHRFSFQASGAPLSILADRDESGPLEHFEMSGNRRLADVERFS